MYRLAPLLLLAACSLYEGSSPAADAVPVQTSPSTKSTTLDGSALDACFEGAVAQPLDCTVSSVQAMGTPNETNALMTPCESGVAFPCWYAAADASCAPSGFALVVVRSTPATAGTMVEADCALGL
ncbi:MAG TPA: hypothetical protein VGG74_22500 [Kofleriaceae bacterium]|jgi:hypothetical protein